MVCLHARALPCFVEIARNRRFGNARKTRCNVSISTYQTAQICLIKLGPLPRDASAPNAHAHSHILTRAFRVPLLGRSAPALVLVAETQAGERDMLRAWQKRICCTCAPFPRASASAAPHMRARISRLVCSQSYYLLCSTQYTLSYLCI